ncbi:hypothetical protein L202_02342 [Cryptococcus amylolentus CBS 6039]|uniref:Enoyl-CoA hydratase n=1 Tax=Cryptococcus amylolentus CBS 6039 TaxID=1295533 RepID=A0A1E3I066_9TREE|nr:hypothetical protein L202_02342 [Cryptococcus amylolentus CBS 6039]ODN82014.1 hypothetical protein L202_02342 [Cryptococcus amylolentus CBS 6039]
MSLTRIPPSIRLSGRLRQSILRRSLSTQSESHAFLRPLLSTRSDSALSELEGVLCLTLNRPKTKNALSVQMVAEMREALTRIETHNARLLLLESSTPSIFCSGADLRERRTMSPLDVSNFLDSLRGLLGELEDVPVPTVAVVDGYALGGGAELALASDLRVGGENTKMALPEAKLGIIPGAGGTQRLTRLVGPSKAKELIFTGRHVNGPEAERIGELYDHVRDDTADVCVGILNIYAQSPSSAREASLILARQILSSAPLALAAAKSAIDGATDSSLDAGLTLEREMYNSLLDTYDRQEGLKAFAEKRRAIFTGR